MDIDRDHIDEAILALLFLGRHDGMRAWKSFDWAAMERLHTKGLISDPVQLLLGHTKIESTVRYLGIEVDDALAIAEQVDV